MQHHYIVVMRDTRMWLVGPFANQADAAEFGRANLSPGGPDDPRWQTIELSHVGMTHTIPVHSPLRAEASAAA